MRGTPNRYVARQLSLMGIPLNVWEVKINDVLCCRAMLHRGELRITERYTRLHINMDLVARACGLREPARCA